MKSGKTKSGGTEVNRAGLARILGCSLRTVTTLEAEQVFVPSVRGKAGKGSVYVLEECVPNFIAYRTAGTKAADENSRSRRDRSQAELNELRLAKERGELLPRDQVVSKGQAYVSRVMAKLRSLPSRAVQEGTIMASSVAGVEALIEEAVLEMAGWTEDHI